MIVAIEDTIVIAGVNAHAMRPAVATTATALATAAIALARLLRRRRRRSSNPSPIRARSTRPMGNLHAILGLSVHRTQPTQRRHPAAIVEAMIATIAAMTAITWRFVLRRRRVLVRDRYRHGATIVAMTAPFLHPIAAVHRWIIMVFLRSR